MSTPEPSRHASGLLLIELDARDLPVSYVSSLLRVLQAALREAARDIEEYRPLFEQTRSPLLLLSTEVAESKLRLNFSFSEAGAEAAAAPSDSAQMTDLSARAFELFMGRFARLLEDTTQLGLWGQVVRGAGPRQPDPPAQSAVDRRLNELRTELRHFDSVRISFGGRTIAFDGDRMQID